MLISNLVNLNLCYITKFNRFICSSGIFHRKTSCRKDRADLSSEASALIFVPCSAKDIQDNAGRNLQLMLGFLPFFPHKVTEFLAADRGITVIKATAESSSHWKKKIGATCRLCPLSPGIDEIKNQHILCSNIAEEYGASFFFLMKPPSLPHLCPQFPGGRCFNVLPPPRWRRAAKATSTALFS